LQVFFLSQMKRIIWGNNPGHWYLDFLGDDIPSLSDIVAVPGAVQCIDLPFGSTPSVTSATAIPSNAIVLRSLVRILIPYPPGVSVMVGQAGAPSLLQSGGDSTLQAAGNEYEAPQRTSWGPSASSVLVTLGGGALTGSGSVTVEWAVPTN
jgi:hypothetical protein